MDITKITPEAVATDEGMRAELVRRREANAAEIRRAVGENKVIDQLLRVADDTTEVLDGVALCVTPLESGNWSVSMANGWWASASAVHALVYRHARTGEWFLRKHGPDIQAGGRLHSVSWTELTPALDEAKAYVARAATRAA